MVDIIARHDIITQEIKLVRTWPSDQILPVGNWRRHETKLTEDEAHKLLMTKYEKITQPR